MKHFVGTSGEGTHDGAYAVVDESGNIKFASLHERFSGTKHDPTITTEVLDEYCPEHKLADTEFWMNDNAIARAEFRPGLYGKLQIAAKNPECRGEKINLEPISWSPPLVRLLNHPRQFATDHHVAHAAASFSTRPQSFDKKDCVMVVLDGIGEMRSGLIVNSDFEVLHEMNFPKSIGYLYANFTNSLPGLKANEDEYVVMGKSCYGEPNNWQDVYEMFQCVPEWTTQDVNQVYTEMNWETRYAQKAFYLERMVKELHKSGSHEDAAASMQRVAEEVIIDFMKVARKYGSKLCYSGGVAQNIMANSRIRDMFDDVWIDVNPGDGGAALGAAAYGYMKHTGADRINWEHPYHGHEITGNLDPEMVVDYIMQNKVAGVANGKAEYSCRAYGNRSLIADVRYDVKDTVNDIKKRQKFRPFAPAILEEHVDDYFDGPTNRWMQYVATAKHDYSSVTHVDGTGRVQLVHKDSHSVFRQILEIYYEKTGIPMLLNTSLNIRGKPMVNDVGHAMDFEDKYGVKVFTK